MHSPGASAWRGGLSAGTFAGHGAGINTTAWRHAQNWGNWGHGEGWGRDFGHHGFYGVGYGYPGWYGWYGGWGWPYYGYGLGYWPYYGYADYGYEPSYYADRGYGSTVSYATPSESYETPSESTVEGTSIEPGQEYFAQAREFFQNGDYQNALRLAGHAAVEAPRNPEVHELASLALFALKDYRGAAMEAHAALTLGPPIDWPTLYSYYENVDTYTNQLRALEKYVRDNPKSPEGHFLLGYHFVMTGHKDAAKKELDLAIAQAPRDKLAQEMVKHL
jgi:tetratricopeptide (TPR) repeat protein